MPGQAQQNDDQESSSLYSEPYDSIEYTYPCHNINYSSKEYPKSASKDHIYESLENVKIAKEYEKPLSKPNSTYANLPEETMVKLRRLSMHEDELQRKKLDKKLKRRSVHFGSIFGHQENSSSFYSNSPVRCYSETKSKEQRKAAEAARNRRRSLILFPGKAVFSVKKKISF